MTETLHARRHGQGHEADEPLTRNQQLVLDALLRTAAPQSAYELLDALRPHGFKAPLQVYRALDKLMARGHVHKLESLSAYVACQHPAGEDTAATVFMICGRCGKVSERTDQCIFGDISDLARKDGFKVSHTHIEVRGHCGNC